MRKLGALFRRFVNPNKKRKGSLFGKFVNLKMKKTLFFGGSLLRKKGSLFRRSIIFLIRVFTINNTHSLQHKPLHPNFNDKTMVIHTHNCVFLSLSVTLSLKVRWHAIFLCQMTFVDVYESLHHKIIIPARFNLSTFLFKHFLYSNHYTIWMVVMWYCMMAYDAIVSICNRYGKVHNIVYCYAYFCLLWHYKRQKMIWWIFLEGGA